MSAPELSPAERQIVARFDAAHYLPELDSKRVDDLAYELACDLSPVRWFDMPEAWRARWREVAAHALTVPGVTQ